MLPPVLLFIALAFIVIAAVVGLLRGFKRFLPSLIVIVGSAILAFAATLMLRDAISGVTDGLVRQALENANAAGALDAMPTAAGVIGSLVPALAAPFLFTVCYFVILIVAGIITAIVMACVRKKSAETEKRSRILGLAAGAVAGLVMAFAFMLPFTGYFGMLSEEIDRLNQVSPGAMDSLLKDQESKEMYANYIEPVLNDPYIKLSYTAGGKAVFHAISSVQVSGEKYPVSNIVSTGLAMYGHAAPLMGEKIANYDSRQSDAIRALVTDLENDALFTNLSAEFISALASSWEKDEAFFEIEPIRAEGNFAPVVNKLVSTFATTSSENIVADMHSVSDMISAMIKYNAVSLLDEESGDFKKVLATPGFVSEFCTAVQKNERMEPVFFEVTKMGVVLVADAMNIPEDASAAEGDRVTRQDILSKLHEVSPSDAEAESQKFEKAVTAAVSVVDSLDGSGENLLFDIDAQAVEDVIVTLNETETFGESVPVLLKGICQSGMLTGAGFSGDGIYNDIMTYGYGNIANTLETVKHAAKMFETLSAPKEETAADEVKVEEEIEWLVSNMTPETSAIITNQINEETIKNYGVSEESAAPVSDLISNMFTSMANETELSQEEYKAESEAISQLFTVATEIKDTGAGESIFDNKVASAADITEVVLNSKVVSDALVNTAYGENGELKEDPLAANIQLSDSDKTSLADALNEYSTTKLPSSEDAEKEKQKIAALASVFNLDIEIGADGTVTYKK